MEVNNDFYASEDPSSGRIWISSPYFSLLRENGVWKSETPDSADIRMNFYPIVDKSRAIAIYQVAHREAQKRPELKRPFQLCPS